MDGFNEVLNTGLLQLTHIVLIMLFIWGSCLEHCVCGIFQTEAVISLFAKYDTICVWNAICFKWLPLDLNIILLWFFQWHWISNPNMSTQNLWQTLTLTSPLILMMAGARLKLYGWIAQLHAWLFPWYFEKLQGQHWNIFTK